MKYLSMFSGVGGFELGIQRAFVCLENQELSWSTNAVRSKTRPNKQLSKLNLERLSCIGYSEIDKYAIETYEHNFKGHKNYGDCTTINEAELPDFDLLVGGFPCQAFSVAGKRKGFNDTRGTLFFDIARILKHKRPRHLVLENVKGLLSHDSGKTFQTILGVLTDLGYDIEWQVLNAKDFGVPQNRERIFFVGHLRGECGRKVFPIGQDGGKANELQRHLANTLTRRYEQAQAVGTYIDEGERDAQKTKPSRQGLLKKGDESNDSNFRGGETYPQRVRRLTPTECERLMSWPDGWTIGSDTQRYKQCGNGVVSNVVEEVIVKVLKCLES